MMRTTWSDLVQRIGCRVRHTQLIRASQTSLTIRLARGCKRWHSLVPRRRYGKKSSLWVYASSSPSQRTTNFGPFLRIKWEIYFYKEVFRPFIEFLKSCMRVYREIRKLWNMRMTLIPIIVGKFGTFFKSLERWQEEVDTRGKSRLLRCSDRTEYWEKSWTNQHLSQTMTHMNFYGTLTYKLIT